MKNVLDSKKKKGSLYTSMIFLFLMIAVATPAMAAIDLEIAGRPGLIMGYVNQGVQFGIAGDHYDTMAGFQASIFQLLVEIQYFLDPNVRIFASTYLNIDWAYPILEDTDKWVEREFDKSRDNLYILDDYETLLKELHVTWSPGDFLFRFGKQIVKWGEMDGVRIMDQINPQDLRRGISDVEFETTIIPIWLMKAEYYPHIPFIWMQDLGFEFIFNCNPDFIATKQFSTGNDVHGIWSPNSSAGLWYEVPGMGFVPEGLGSILPPPLDQYPIFESRVGAISLRIDEPKSWDPDYFEYGLRLKTIMLDTQVTLNGFYGIENSPVLRPGGGETNFRVASDGVLIVEPAMEGSFPRLQYLGFTLARDFENLTIRWLGGVAPVLRMEAFYAFDSTFSTSGKVDIFESMAGGHEDFEKHDEIRYAIGIDWKVRIRWLNPRDSFMISGQFMHLHIMDYPSDYGLMAAGPVPVDENNYTTTAMLRTTYFHNKLIPMVFWQRSYRGELQGDLIIVQLVYDRSYHWNYTVNAVWAGHDGMSAMDHKDNVTFTVSYRY